MDGGETIAILTSNSRADVAVGKADSFSAAPSTHVSSATRLVCNLVMIPIAFSQLRNLHTKPINQQTKMTKTNKKKTTNRSANCPQTLFHRTFKRSTLA